jgi:hypothetical protein
LCEEAEEASLRYELCGGGLFEEVVDWVLPAIIRWRSGSTIWYILLLLLQGAQLAFSVSMNDPFHFGLRIDGMVMDLVEHL